jgi:chaperonin GroES
MKQKFTPLGKRVLVKLDAPKDRTDSGLYLPETAQKDFITGVVENVGKEAENVSKGDKIMFASSVGVDIEVNGQQFRLIPDELYIDAII